MAEQDRLAVGVLFKQLDQTIDPFGEALDRESDVLNDHRRAGLAHRADRWKGVLADLPELVVDDRVFAEIDLFLHREMSNRDHDLVDLLVQKRPAGCAGFDQQRAGIGRQLLDPLRHAGLVLHRAQAAAIKQFHCRHRLLLEHGYGEAAGFYIGKDNQRAGFVRVIWHGVVGHSADETQCAFGADHQVVEDVEWLVVVDQRIEREASGVLKPVLVANFRRQVGVGAGGAA